MGINKLLKWADTNIKKKKGGRKKNEIKKIQKAHRKFKYNIINIIKKDLDANLMDIRSKNPQTSLNTILKS